MHCFTSEPFPKAFWVAIYLFTLVAGERKKDGFPNMFIKRDSVCHSERLNVDVKLD
jgi:hypothetical protein